MKLGSRILSPLVAMLATAWLKEDVLDGVLDRAGPRVPLKQYRRMVCKAFRNPKTDFSKSKQIFFCKDLEFAVAEIVERLFPIEGSFDSVPVDRLKELFTRANIMDKWVRSRSFWRQE